jgi:hypothetical protein
MLTTKLDLWTCGCAVFREGLSLSSKCKLPQLGPSPNLILMAAAGTRILPFPEEITDNHFRSSTIAASSATVNARICSNAEVLNLPTAASNQHLDNRFQGPCCIPRLEIDGEKLRMEAFDSTDALLLK